MTRERKIVQTSVIGIISNILLVVAKSIIGFIANSISIITDAINNLSDVLSSLITIIGTKIAGKKPDKKHPFGHGRMEYLTSMIIAVIILVSATMAIYESIQTLIQGRKASYDYVSIIVVSIAIAVKVALGIYFKVVGKKVDSEALKASGTDALFDSLLSTATLVGVLVSMLCHVDIEGYLGIAIGLFMIRSGIEILVKAYSSVIGERMEKETSLQLKKIVTSFPEVRGVYDLVINNYGPTKSIGSIHIEVDDHMTAKEIHPLTRKITEKVYMELGIILTVGIYAKNESSEEILEIKKAVHDLVKNYPSFLQIHGFYVDEEKKQISFDLVYDFGAKNVENDVEEIKKVLKEQYPSYDYYVVLDNDVAD